MEQTQPGIWNSVFIKVFIVNMLSQYGVYSMNTLSAPYANSLGATATIAGMAASFFGPTAMIFKLVSAPAIDSFDRKKVLVFSLGIMLISFIGYAFSSNVAMLLISRLLTGVGMAFVPTCCIAIASSALPAEKMSTGIGVFALGTAFIQAAGPAVGLWLVVLVGYNKTFAIFAALIVCTMIFAATMNIDYHPAKKFKISAHSIFAGEVIIPTVILMLMNLVFCNVNAFLVLFGETQKIGKTQIGYFFTVLAVTLVFSRPMIGKLADTYGSGKIVMASMVCFAASFLVISYSHNLPMFLFSGFLSAFGYAGSQPALLAVCMRSVPVDRRGAAGCTSYIGQDIGNIVGPLIAGTIVERMGYVSMWQLMIVPIVLAMIITVYFRRQLDMPGKLQPAAK